MAWNDLPIWLKFAIVFSIVNTILFLVSLYNYSNATKEVYNDMSPFAFLIYGLTTYPTILLFMLFSGKGKIAEIITLFFAGIINWFIIGALIGWIVGKIKSKK